MTFRIVWRLLTRTHIVELLHDELRAVLRDPITLNHLIHDLLKRSAELSIPVQIDRVFLFSHFEVF
jgi:hypothetical protein